MKLSDLPPHLREQAERQLAPSRPSPAAPSRPSPSVAAKPKRPPLRLPAPRVPNATESRFNADFLDGRGSYEGLSFRVPSGRYTPDWILHTPSGLVAVEVKGAYKFGSQSAASAKFKEAVAAHPSVTFVWAQWKNGSWNLCPVPPRPVPPCPKPLADALPPPDGTSRAPARPSAILDGNL